MAIRIFFSLILSFILCHFQLVIGQQANESSQIENEDRRSNKLLVELLVAPNSGNVIFGVDTRRVRQVWTEMFIRGTSELENMPFDPVLYAKYYQRMIQEANSNVPKKVSAYSSFRDHQAQPGITKAWDKPKFTPLPWETMWLDLQSSSIFSKIPKDSITGDPLWMRWPWSKLEWKQFAIFELDSLDASVVDSIQALVVTRGNDLLQGWQSQKIDLNRIQQELGLNKTLANLISDSSLPSNRRYWLENLINKEVKPAEITLLQALRNENISKQFLQLINKRVMVKWLHTQ